MTGFSDAPKRRPRHPEMQLQQHIVSDVRDVLLPPALLIAFPAGGGGRKRGAILRGMGLLPGMTDLVLFWDCRAWGIEVKTETGRLSSDQREMHAALRGAGIPVAVVRSSEQAIANIVIWGIPTRLTAAERALFQRANV